MSSEHIPEAEAKVDDSKIQRNAAGIPIFPKVDLEQLAPAVVLELLKNFISSLWCKRSLFECFVHTNRLPQFIRGPRIVTDHRFHGLKSKQTQGTFMTMGSFACLLR